MSKKSFGSLFWVASLVACGACSTVAEEPTPIREQGLELSAATRSLPFKISLPQRSVDDATTTVREVLGVIVGVDVAAGNFDLVPSREGGRIAGRVRSAPRIV